MASIRSGIVVFPSIVLLSLVMAFAAYADNCELVDAEAVAWLDKMSDSVRHNSYHGVVSLQRGEDVQYIQVSHLVQRGVSSQHLIQLTGHGAGVTRSAHPLECLHPGHQLLKVSEALEAGRCGLAQHYQFSVGGAERIAGRTAVKLTVKPRDMYRYGYRLALDRETGLLLKTETFAQSGKVLEKFQYASLSYGDKLPGTTEVEVVHEAAHPHPDHSGEGRSVMRAWQVNWLPRGFMLTDASGGESGRQSFTDGLAVFSVFLENFDREIRAGEGVVRQGGTLSYTRGMRLSEQAVLVTVIGEIPVNTARMVADSLSWTE